MGLATSHPPSSPGDPRSETQSNSSPVSSSPCSFRGLGPASTAFGRPAPESLCVAALGRGGSLILSCTWEHPCCQRRGATGSAPAWTPGAQIEVLSPHVKVVNVLFRSFVALFPPPFLVIDFRKSKLLRRSSKWGGGAKKKT